MSDTVLLDHELAEYVGRIPFVQKMHRLDTKLALRRAVGPRLPRSVLERSKMGFGIPLDRWLREGLADQVRDTLLAPEAERAARAQPGCNQCGTQALSLVAHRLWLCTVRKPPNAHVVIVSSVVMPNETARIAHGRIGPGPTSDDSGMA